MPARIPIMAMAAVHGFREVVWGGCAIGVLFKSLISIVGPARYLDVYFNVQGRKGSHFLLPTIFAVLTRVTGEIPVPCEARYRKNQR
jgi:hypothetical protein